MQELYERAKDGDSSAESQLLQNLFVRFVSFGEHRVGRSDAEDVAQKACIIIHEKYRTQEIETTFGAWSFGVYKNVMLKSIDKGSRDSKKLDHLREAMPRSSQHEENPLLHNKLLGCMRDLIKTFQRYGRILNLRHQGFTTEEVCERINVTREQYYVYLGRGRSILKACLEDHGVEVST
jgi:RNA polymerase sigma factor (sigma-70 family)